MTETIRSFRDLVAWQKATALCLEIYRLTSQFPTEERFGLSAQLRRAAVGVPSNIAEGYGRGTSADYVRFCRLARGSLYEVETQIIIAAQLGYIPEHSVQAVSGQIDECSRILGGLIRSIRNWITTTSTPLLMPALPSAQCLMPIASCLPPKGSPHVDQATHVLRRRPARTQKGG